LTLLKQYIKGENPYENERIEAEVNEQFHANENGELPREIVEYWNALLPHSIEFAVKRFIIATMTQLKFIRENTTFRLADLAAEKENGIPKMIELNSFQRIVNLLSILQDLLQFEDFTCKRRNKKPKHQYELDQKISSLAIKDYIKLQSKSSFL
jgi:hypothetical protein